MLRWLYDHGFSHLIDYEITGEYYDTSDGVHYAKKYNKRYFFKKNAK